MGRARDEVQLRRALTRHNTYLQLLQLTRCPGPPNFSPS